MSEGARTLEQGVQKLSQTARVSGWS